MSHCNNMQRSLWCIFFTSPPHAELEVFAKLHINIVGARGEPEIKPKLLRFHKTVPNSKPNQHLLKTTHSSGLGSSAGLQHQIIHIGWSHNFQAPETWKTVLETLEG